MEGSDQSPIAKSLGPGAEAASDSTNPAILATSSSLVVMSSSLYEHYLQHNGHSYNTRYCQIDKYGKGI